jgi:hypothetical protein
MVSWTLRVSAALKAHDVDIACLQEAVVAAPSGR